MVRSQRAGRGGAKGERQSGSERGRQVESLPNQGKDLGFCVSRTAELWRVDGGCMTRPGVLLEEAACALA